MSDFKNAIASSLVISFGIILIIHFALFWAYGGVFIYENNKVVLLVETIMSLSIILFGVERLINSAGKNRARTSLTTLDSQQQQSGSIRLQIPLNVNSDKETIPSVANSMRMMQSIPSPSAKLRTEYSTIHTLELTSSNKGAGNKHFVYQDIEDVFIPSAEVLAISQHDMTN